MDRRDLLKTLSALAGCSLTNRLVEAAGNRALLAKAAPRSALDASQRRMVEQLAELIIPRTDTPGAIDAGAPLFIEQIVSGWYSQSERILFLDGLDSIDAWCTAHHGQGFLFCDSAAQTAALTAAEVAASSYRPAASQGVFGVPDEQSPFFFKLRLLTVLGFYTSEVGATQELAYDPVPGMYDGDVDFDAVGGRQWST